jgi:vitamin B12 transporter
LKKSIGPRPGQRLAFASAAGSAIALVLAAGAAEAQETRLPGIVVEGATLSRPVVRTAPPVTAPQAAPAEVTDPPASDSGDAGVPLSEVGSSVTVVTGEQLRDRQVRTAAEALQSLPGVHVSSNSTPASVTEVRIRGAENNHTLVLVDGVPANDPTSGAYDFSDLSTADIERIEVIRGAQSVIYGSGAVGGVINIITRSGRGPARVTIATEVGSFGTREIALAARGGSERVWGALTYNARKSDGFNIAPVGSERDRSELETFAFRGGVQVMPGLVIDGSLRLSRKAGERDGFDGAPGTLATAVDDASRFTGNVLLGSVRARWETFGGALTHEFRTTYNETKTTDTDLLFPASPFLSKYDAESRTHSYLATLKLPGNPALFTHTVAGLVEWNEESFTPLGDFTDGLRRSRDRLAFAGEWRGTFARQLHLTAGIRHDDNSAFDDFTSWRGTAAWQVPGMVPGMGLRPHASIGTGFKAPTFFEQFGSIPSFFTPNPDLTPEETFGWDAGIELSVWRGRLVFDVTYFSAELENKIAPNPGFVPTLINLPGTSHRNGIEVSAKYRVRPGLTVGATYTYLDATDPDGTREVRRPPHAGRVDVDAAFADGRGRFHFAAIYNGRRDDLAFRVGPTPFDPWTNEIVSLDSIWRLSTAVSFKVRPDLEVFGRIENLLDDRGQEVFGFAQPGVAAYAGLRLTLGGEAAPLGGSSGR